MNAEIFAVAASITVVFVYLTYFKQVARDESIPNPATWIIWLVVNLLNAATYFLVVSGDHWKSLITVITSSCVIGIFLYTLSRGKFAKIQLTEKVCLGLALAVGMFWQTTNNARVSNLMLQLVFVISFIPTATGLWRGNLKERWHPWGLAVLAYLFQICSLLSDFDNNWIALAYPVVNGVLGNGSIALLSIIKKPRLE